MRGYLGPKTSRLLRWRIGQRFTFHKPRPNSTKEPQDLQSIGRELVPINQLDGAHGLGLQPVVQEVLGSGRHAPVHRPWWHLHPMQSRRPPSSRRRPAIGTFHLHSNRRAPTRSSCALLAQAITSAQLISIALDFFARVWTLGTGGLRLEWLYLECGRCGQSPLPAFILCFTSATWPWPTTCTTTLSRTARKPTMCVAVLQSLPR